MKVVHLHMLYIDACKKRAAGGSIANPASILSQRNVFLCMVGLLAHFQLALRH